MPGHNFLDDVAVDATHCDAMRADCRRDIVARLEIITEKFPSLSEQINHNTTLTQKIDKDLTGHMGYHNGVQSRRWVLPLLVTLALSAVGAAFLIGKIVGGP